MTSAAAAAKTSSVLIVDDDPNIYMLLLHGLKLPEVRFEYCGTAADAVQKLTSKHFDAVLLDLGLPDGNGFDVMRSFSPDEVTRFIIITADDTPEALVEAVRERAYSFIRKPLNTTYVREVLTACLTAAADDRINVLSAKPEWLEISLPCTREAANRIDLFMRQFKERLSDDDRERVAQAFRELLLNAVEWGGGLDPKRRVTVACLRTGRLLLYRIADPGEGFRFDKLAHAAVGHPDNPIEHMEIREQMGLRPGGLGLAMIQAFADDLVYNEKQNEVVFIKYLG